MLCQSKDRKKLQILSCASDTKRARTKRITQIVPALSIPGLAGLCRSAGISSEKQQTGLLIFCLFCCATLLLAVILRQSILLTMPLIAGCLQYLLLKQLKRSRVTQFDKDYTALLLSLASSIRAGLDPLQALLRVDRLFQEESLVRKELLQLKGSLQHGKTEEEVITEFASSIAHPDVHLFRAALILARSEGSSLGMCLERLTKITRQRQSFRRKSMSAVAMQKLSAYGISGCALIIASFQLLTNTDATIKAYQHPTGKVMIFTGVGLMLVGLLWMKRLCRLKL